MKFECKNCKATYTIDSSKIPAAGAWATCKKCGIKIQIFPEYSHKKIIETRNKAIDKLEIKVSNQNKNHSKVPIIEKPISLPPSPTSPKIGDSINDDHFQFYVGKNWKFYQKHFSKFYQDGKDKYKPTWNWPAFLFPFFWLFYRKLYLWSIIGWFANSNIITMILFGLAGNWIYYRHSKKNIVKINTKYITTTPDEIRAYLEQKGGVNYFAVLIPIIVIIGLSLLAI